MKRKWMHVYREVGWSNKLLWLGSSLGTEDKFLQVEYNELECFLVMGVLEWSWWTLEFLINNMENEK